MGKLSYNEKLLVGPTKLKNNVSKTSIVKIGQLGLGLSIVYNNIGQSSSSRMRVIYHNWSATKQRPHPQSVAEISHHLVLSGDRIRQCETSSGSHHKDTDQCL